jgi:hypothetical protein
LEYYIKIFPTKFISLILDKLLNFTNFGRLLQHLNIFKRNYEIEKEENRPTGPVLAQGLRVHGLPRPGMARSPGIALRPK